MADVIQTLKKIKDQLAQAQQEATRAEVEHERAVASRKRALDVLKTEFGVSSLEEAEKLQELLSSELEEKIAELEAALEGLSA